MKSSISAKIPTELYEEVQDAIKAEKYTSNTECIIKGLTLLLRNTDQEDSEIKCLLQEKEKEIQNLQSEVKSSKEEIQVLLEKVNRSKDEVDRSKDKVKCSKEEYTGQIRSLEERLAKAAEPSELAQLHARYEEIEKHNETLIKELEKAERDKEDLKTTYNNYFLHVQTLINQKAIEATGAKKPWWRFW